MLGGTPGLGALGGLAVLAAGSAAAAPATVSLCGRVTFLVDEAPLSVGEVQKQLKAEVRLPLRRGFDVVTVTLGADGVFCAEVPPGAYRVEYLQIGDAVEFVQPAQLELRAGQSRCAGTLTADVTTLDKLGKNERNHTTWRQDCDTFKDAVAVRHGPQGALASVPALVEEPGPAPDVVVLLSGLFGGAQIDGKGVALRLSYRYGLLDHDWGDDGLVAEVQGGPYLTNPFNTPPGTPQASWWLGGSFGYRFWIGEARAVGGAILPLGAYVGAGLGLGAGPLFFGGVVGYAGGSGLGGLYVSGYLVLSPGYILGMLL